MIEVSQLNFRFPKSGRSFFSNLNFSMEAGSRLALVGPSGIGKTTFLQLLAGLLPYQGGEIRIGGEAYSPGDDRAFSRLRNRDMGIIFQDYNLLRELTVEENLRLRLAIAGKPASEGQFMPLLEKVGLSEHRKLKAGRLSGGQQQRLAAVRAMLVSPRILLADEPTGNLDDASAEALVEMLLGVPGQTTVLVTTHDPRVLRHFSQSLAFETLVQGT